MYKCENIINTHIIYTYTCIKTHIQGSTKGFIVDAISTSLGALMGTSPVSTYVESAIGVQDGGDIFVAE